MLEVQGLDMTLVVVTVSWLCYSEYQNDTPNGQQITEAAIAITAERLLLSEGKALGALANTVNDSKRNHSHLS
jgi:hypothetical protein